MARPQPNEPDPPPATASGGESERSVREVAAQAPAPDASSAPSGALFRSLLATGMDAAAAYTAVREMESTAGQNVVTQLGAQIQSLATTLARVESGLAAIKTDVATVKTDVAVLKREVRLIWLLLIPTFAAILVRLFTG